MNNFLKTRDEITKSTEWLKENGYVTHPISCKDWELANVTRHINDGNLLDMGANGSFVLHNATKKDYIGKRVGIDLSEVTGDNKADGAEYYIGDLMHTPFADGEFDIITSCSVIEHEVDFIYFAKESARLLYSWGRLYVSFDYWPEKINTDGLTLYGLKWNILNDSETADLIYTCNRHGLNLTSDIDWETKDAVINPAYCSPFPGISYTFGILEFIKQ